MVMQFFILQLGKNQNMYMHLYITSRNFVRPINMRVSGHMKV